MITVVHVFNYAEYFFLPIALVEFLLVQWCNHPNKAMAKEIVLKLKH